MSNLLLPKIDDDEYLYFSPEGFQKLASIYDPKDPYKNFNWTNDYTLELPIRLKKQGPGILILKLTLKLLLKDSLLK